MTILTREQLGDGRFRERLRLPEAMCWSEAQLARSLDEVWSQRTDEHCWVFGYGSLMWNPLLHVEEVRQARLDGWRRSFCVRSISGRGSPSRPGRVLALQPGGHVDGLALRLPRDRATEELRLLWAREMTSGCYRPAWVPLALAGGGQARAITFLFAPGHPLHEDDDSPRTVAGQVATAAGVFGANVDYVRALGQALEERGIRDAYVEAVLAALGAHEAAR